MQTSTTTPISALLSDNSVLPPTLGEGFSTTSPSSPSAQNPNTSNITEETDPKSKKKFWQLGKKKDNKTSSETTGAAIAGSTTIPPQESSSSRLRSTSPQPQYAMASPASPGRMASTSPRLASPAESQIFERNVQEDSAAVAASPAIPSHIATENHIPPVLDASSMAITDNHLTPDTVEIVTHAAHLPAAAAMTGSVHAESTLSSPVADEAPQSLQDTSDEPTPSYAALDSADIRRLSFISFADVVHGEQAADGTMRDSVLSAASSIASPLGRRSPSPLRSPISPTMGIADGSAGLGLDSSPNRRMGPGSPRSPAATNSPTVTGEIAIETLRQALRKTESQDVGAASRGSVSAL